MKQLTEAQKKALERMVDNFLFVAASRGVTDQERIKRLIRESLHPRNAEQRAAVEYAVTYVSTREVGAV